MTEYDYSSSSSDEHYKPQTLGYNEYYLQSNTEEGKVNNQFQTVNSQSNGLLQSNLNVNGKVNQMRVGNGRSDLNNGNQLQTSNSQTNALSESTQVKKIINPTPNQLLCSKYCPLDRQGNVNELYYPLDSTSNRLQQSMENVLRIIRNNLSAKMNLINRTDVVFNQGLIYQSINGIDLKKLFIRETSVEEKNEKKSMKEKMRQLRHTFMVSFNDIRRKLDNNNNNNNNNNKQLSQTKHIINQLVDNDTPLHILELFFQSLRDGYINPLDWAETIKLLLSLKTPSGYDAGRIMIKTIYDLGLNLKPVWPTGYKDGNFVVNMFIKSSQRLGVKFIWCLWDYLIDFEKPNGQNCGELLKCFRFTGQYEAFEEAWQLVTCNGHLSSYNVYQRIMFDVYYDNRESAIYYFRYGHQKHFWDNLGCKWPTKIFVWIKQLERKQVSQINNSVQAGSEQRQYSEAQDLPSIPL